MEQLRRRRRAAWEISEEIGVPTSTVSRHQKRLGLGRIWRVEEAEDPPPRYEHKSPGSLLHIDAKKFARIDGVGHRIHGDRSKKKHGVGWEVVCVDDHTRETWKRSRDLSFVAKATKHVMAPWTTPDIHSL